ncbi:hypothetical protein [Sandarakinorhabdus sp.]|uniref:hypothetical protein n=1 Tax=Sandarakinorhabdus sp. TaxID=1916663 RepID=UPI00356B5CA7
MADLSVFGPGVTIGAAALMLAAGMLATGPAMAQNRRPPTEPQSFDSQAWRRVPVRPGGGEISARPPPPRAGQTRCIAINGIAGAQLYGDRAIELSMRGGRRWRLHLAQECPALSFYQGFYYQQKKAGQLCAGRDAIGARSGGECGIAAIVPASVPAPVPPAKARRRR